MIVCTWNVKRATSKSNGVWNIINSIDADILFLQEVSSFPKELLNTYNIVSKHPLTKNGNQQKFSSVFLTKGSIKNINLKSSLESVNQAYSSFDGNLIASEIIINNS